MLVPLALLLATSVPSDPCDRRADVVAIRAAAVAGAPALTAARARAEAGVVAAAEGRARGCAAAVAAEAALLAGDRAATLGHLDTLVGALPELAEAVRPHRALLLVELGRLDEARAEHARIDPRSAWHERLAWQVAVDDAAARQILKRRAGRDLEALAALCERGDAPSCTTLLLRHPAHPTARAREDAAVTTWSMAARAERSKKLVAVARPRRAILEGQAAAARTDVAAADRKHQHALIETLANALWRAERTAEALPLTERFRDDGGAVIPPVTRARARTFARLGRFAEASQTWALLRDAAGASADDRAEAAFFAAFALVEDVGEGGGEGDAPSPALARAFAAFDDGADEMAGTSWAEQATWYRAFLLLTALGDPTTAEGLLASLASTKTEPRKYRYWRAQALRELKRPKEADALLRALHAESASDWYGLLARRDLGLAPVAGAAVAADVLVKQAPDDDDARSTRLLFALGFDEEARQACRRRAQGKRAPSLAEVGLCQQVEDPTFGWRHGGFFSPRIEVKGDRVVGVAGWRASFARPWRGDVDAAAAAAGIAPTFVMGIMRTESGFDPTAVSIAGARGLMQLLPSVARATATVSSVPVAVAERLNDPDAAILLGAHLLGRLKREHGSTLMAAAAYNAGPEPAARWAARHGHLPVEQFVERIAFKETRNYVKKVLAAEATYRALDGGPLALDLPAGPIVPAKDFTRLPYDE